MNNSNCYGYWFSFDVDLRCFSSAKPHKTSAFCHSQYLNNLSFPELLPEIKFNPTRVRVLVFVLGLYSEFNPSRERSSPYPIKGLTLDFSSTDMIDNAKKLLYFPNRHLKDIDRRHIRFGGNLAHQHRKLFR